MPITGAVSGTVPRMTARSLFVGAALTLALLVPSSSATTQAHPQEPAPRAVAPRVLAISVDGLNTDAIQQLGPSRAPTFYRLLQEGAGTLNARTEFEQSVTLPNHTSMMTSRRITRSAGGHGVTWDDDRRRMTVQRAAGHPVSSVFNVVERSGGHTALFSTKSKFGLYKRSWKGNIDKFVVDEDQARLVGKARADLTATRRAFTFLHISLPDRTGHKYGGMSGEYVDAVRRTDRHLGTLLAAIDKAPALSQSVRIILTADHGFAPGGTSHSTRNNLANYRIPFLVWGTGVTAGDIYSLNPDYKDPGTSRPAYAAARQPVRNGDLGNLALDLLGLRTIPGSLFNADKALDVQ